MRSKYLSVVQKSQKLGVKVSIRARVKDIGKYNQLPGNKIHARDTQGGGGSTDLCVQ